MNLKAHCMPPQNVFDRNRGDQASTFLLTQLMGGGKTHNMMGRLRTTTGRATNQAGCGYSESRCGTFFERVNHECADD